MFESVGVFVVDLDYALLLRLWDGQDWSEMVRS
jgi:hypothetical protein